MGQLRYVDICCSREPPPKLYIKLYIKSRRLAFENRLEQTSHLYRQLSVPAQADRPPFVKYKIRGSYDDIPGFEIGDLEKCSILIFLSFAFAFLIKLSINLSFVYYGCRVQISDLRSQSFVLYASFLLFSICLEKSSPALLAFCRTGEVRPRFLLKNCSHLFG